MEKKIYNFYLNLAFPDCNSSLNSLMALKNDAQCLMLHRRGTLLFFEVIHQISRSYRPKNQLFDSNLSKITGLVKDKKSLRFALLFQLCVVGLLPFAVHKGCPI